MERRTAYILLSVVAAAPLGVACSAASAPPQFTGAGGSTSVSASTSASANGGAPASSSGGLGGASFVTSSGAGGGACNPGPNDDYDKDGWTIAQGDCNDCDPNVNPGAIDTPAHPGPDGGVIPAADNNCDKMITTGVTCDANLAIGDVNPAHGANAIELCQTATMQDKLWGVISANYVRANGTVYNPGTEVGILPSFGPNVKTQAGASMLVLSSGRARVPGQAGVCANLSCTSTGNGTAPTGFPQSVPNCPPVPQIVDDTALELQIRAPSNATGYTFHFKFYSFEYPTWVCTNYNDQFITLVNPAPLGAINGNISFDSMHNPVSVNLGYFEVCDPASLASFASKCVAGGNPNCPAKPTPYCPSGLTELMGTGFDTLGGSTVKNGGGTTWLQTTAPVKGGSIFTIRFAIWDSGNYQYDSTVLIDDFQWLATGGTVSTGTVPVTM